MVQRASRILGMSVRFVHPVSFGSLPKTEMPKIPIATEASLWGPEHGVACYCRADLGSPNPVHGGRQHEPIDTHVLDGSILVGAVVTWIQCFGANVHVI